VSSIRDKSKVDAFAREIAGMIGVDVDEARDEVRRAARRSTRPPDPRRREEQAPVEQPARAAVPDPREPRYAIERETLKLVIQHPMGVGRVSADIGTNDFTHPTYRAVWELIAAAGGPVVGADDPGWAARLRDAAADPAVSSAISELGVEPLKKDANADYVALHMFSLLELTAMRRIAEVKSRLQRTNPVEQAAEYNKMFGELAALEQHRRTLRDRIVGAQ
jgi:DNA primase